MLVILLFSWCWLGVLCFYNTKQFWPSFLCGWKSGFLMPMVMKCPLNAQRFMVYSRLVLSEWDKRIPLLSRPVSDNPFSYCLLAFRLASLCETALTVTWNLTLSKRLSIPYAALVPLLGVQFWVEPWNWPTWGASCPPDGDICGFFFPSLSLSVGTFEIAL